MSFRNVKLEYAKYKVLAERNGFILAKDVDAKDFYMFGTEEDLNHLSLALNQAGTLAEVLAELRRWKKEIDSENLFMLEIENEFVNALKNVA